MADYIFWHDRASDEYENLYEYLLDEWGEAIATKVIAEIDKTIINIQTTPEHYPIFLKKKKIRRCVASAQTSIFFKVNYDTVEILAIFDNRQNPKKRKL